MLRERYINLITGTFKDIYGIRVSICSCFHFPSRKQTLRICLQLRELINVNLTVILADRLLEMF